MEKVKKTWVSLLLGALLVATLVGAVWARPRRAPVEDTVAHKLDKPKSHHGGYHYTLTLSGAAFHPMEEGYNWYNMGWWLEMNSGGSAFLSTVPILPGNRTVESVTMYVDDESSYNACMYLYRTKVDGSRVMMTSICSTGSSPGIRSFSDNSPSPNKIWGGHGAYIMLSIEGPDVYVYSVQIKYY